MQTKESEQSPHQNRGRRRRATWAIFGVALLAPGVARAGQLPLYGALPLCTPTVTVPAGGMVYCQAIAQSPADKPIHVLAARILGAGNRLVSQFGYGFGAAPGVVSVGWYAEEVTESFSLRSRFCQVLIDPVSVQLTVDFEVHLNGQPIFHATEQNLGPCPTNSGQNS